MKEAPTVRSPCRLTVEITHEQHLKLLQYFDYGMRKKIFGIIVQDVCQMLDIYGSHFLIALLQKSISYKGLMESYTKKLLSTLEQEEGSGTVE